MSKPWVGYVAVLLMFIAGIFEWLGGYPGIGILLIVLSVISLFIRIYINKRQGGNNTHS